MTKVRKTDGHINGCFNLRQTCDQGYLTSLKDLFILRHLIYECKLASILANTYGKLTQSKVKYHPTEDIITILKGINYAEEDFRHRKIKCHFGNTPKTVRRCTIAQGLDAQRSHATVTSP